MRAMLLERPGPISDGPLRLVDLPTPDAGPGMLVVRVGACGVCRTDLQLVEGDIGARALPIVPGHQVVGRVESTGQGVADFRVGDRVGIAWLGGADGVCSHCQAGDENLCEHAVFTGWDSHGGY